MTAQGEGPAPVACDLLPCPFCGGAAIFECVSDDGRWSVGCSDEDGDCYGYQSLQTFSRKADALAAWNRRAAPAPDLAGLGEVADQGCTIPPEGWWCSREPGHEGPCAARQKGAGR